MRMSIIQNVGDFLNYYCFGISFGIEIFLFMYGLYFYYSYFLNDFCLYMIF